MSLCCTRRRKPKKCFAGGAGATTNQPDARHALDLDALSHGTVWIAEEDNLELFGNLFR
jgi:hypothetical protein